MGVPRFPHRSRSSNLGMLLGLLESLEKNDYATYLVTPRTELVTRLPPPAAPLLSRAPSPPAQPPRPPKAHRDRA